MKWLQVNIFTTSFGSDLVSLILMDAGSEGVSIEDDRDIAELMRSKRTWDYADESLFAAQSGRVTVTGCFSEDTDLSMIRLQLEDLKMNAAEDVGSLETVVRFIDSADWENEWKKYYAPIELNTVAIVPAWQAYESADRRVVRLDPGSAFGTGSHETTYMCLSLLERTALRGRNIIDIGCGSGILAAAALTLGARHALLTDIDEHAVTAAKGNLALNGLLEQCTFLTADRLPAEAEADVLLCNLTADILLALFADIRRAARPGATVIVSGVIEGRQPEIERTFADGFAAVEREKKGDWHAFKFERVHI